MSPRMKAPKPLPCPFCGGMPVVTRFRNYDNEPPLYAWSVACNTKNVCTSYPIACNDTKAQAIRDWNTRAPASAPFASSCSPVRVRSNRTPKE